MEGSDAKTKPGLIGTKPGDRVEVTGIFRATSVRTNPRHRMLRAIYKTYVDIVHIKKLDSSSRLRPDDEGNDPVDRHHES